MIFSETSARFQTSRLEELRGGILKQVGQRAHGRRVIPAPSPMRGRGWAAVMEAEDFETGLRRCVISGSRRRGVRGRMGWGRRSRSRGRFLTQSSYVDNYVGRRSLRASMRLRPEDLPRFRRSSSRRSSLIRSPGEALSDARSLRLHTDEGQSEGRAKPRAKQKTAICRDSLGRLR